MRVNFINNSFRRFYQINKRELTEAVLGCIEKGEFIVRDELKKFEKNLAKYVGTKYAVGVNSGTDALGLSLEALGVGLGDEVITVSHVFIAPIQEIVRLRATPVLVDVGKDCVMDMDKVEQAITKKTRAIIPVHLSGVVCDMKRLMEIAKKHNIVIVEDACQALGSIQDNKKAGSWGETGCFSFISPKMMGAYGDGGAIVTNRKDLYQKLLLLRNHWNITQNALLGVQPKQPKIMGWGHNSRLDNIHAAVLNVKFKHINWIINRRELIATEYLNELADLPLELPSRKPGETWQEFIICSRNRAKFKKHMEKCGVELLIRDTTPNHKLKGLNLSHFNLPVTERLAKVQARLPIYPELFDQEVNHIIDSVRKFYGK